MGDNRWCRLSIVGARHASPARTGLRMRRPELIYDPNKHHRRSIRLKGFDYTREAAYFVTICIQNGTCLFGEIVNGQMRLNDAGRVAQMMWKAIPTHFPHVETDAWVVMPNHVHGIIITVGATHASPPRQSGPPKGSLGAIVGSYKSAVSRQINQLHGTPGALVWQRNYYEHIIRNNTGLNRIRKYIAGNPAHWDEDMENPIHHGKGHTP